MQAKTSFTAIWKIAYPIMIGSMAQTFLGVTDTAFLARVGEIELGASAISGVFYFVFVMIGMAMGIGAQILMSRKAGENDPGAIGKIFDHSFLLLISLSVILFSCVFLFSSYLFSSIISSPSILLAANIFLKFRIWGIFFIFITIVFRSFYVSIAQTRIITYSAIVMASVNIILDYLLIFGHYGFPKLGLEGAAIASAISEAVAAFYLVFYTAFKQDIKLFRLFKFDKLRKEMFAGILKISSSIVMQHLISMGAWFAFFIFIERLGEHELAISNIVRSNYMVLMTPIWGFSSAANSMVSNLIGQKKPEQVMGLLKKIIKLSFATEFVLVFLCALFARQVLGVTTADPKLIDDSLWSFYIVCAATLIFSISMVMFSGVSGTGATREAMFLESFNIFIYLVFVYVCSIIIITPIEIVWLAEVLYWFLMGLFAWYYLKSRRWQIISI